MLEIYKLGTEDLQLNNRWYCYFEDLWKSSFMVKSINLPFEKLLTETKKYGDKKYVGFVPVETITITFFENTKFEIYKFFKDWMDKIFDSETKTFRVLDNVNVKYKTAKISFYTSILGLTSIEYNLKDLMILGINEITLDQESGVPLEWSVDLAVNDITSSNATFGSFKKDQLSGFNIGTN